jgi:hypothetical protein
MRTNENRAKHNRDHLRYPSDLTRMGVGGTVHSAGEAWLGQVLIRLVFLPSANPSRCNGAALSQCRQAQGGAGGIAGVPRKCTRAPFF